MHTAIATNPRYKFFDANGNPAADYLLYTYAAGTLTPQTTWANKNQSTANTNPIVLDAVGECILWLDADKEYKFVLKTPGGSVINTTDNISGPDSGLRTALSLSTGSAMIGIGGDRTQDEKNAEFLSVLDKGAIGDGVADDTAAIQSALSSSKFVFVPPGTYKITAKLITQAGAVVYGAGRDSTSFVKAYNGYMLNLARWGLITGIRFDGSMASFTGGGIEISTGDNTPTVASQGHQRVDLCRFENFDGYAVDYTVANKGWMSRVTRCTFTGTNDLAAIRWPDEPTNGGNRYAIDNYSAMPIVNANGCDNGIVSNNVTGGSATTGQGVVFPAGTTNRAKKVIVTGNRFAIAAGTINIRGTDHIFSSNVIAGSVQFESNAASDGSANVTWSADNIITGTITDVSAASNQVFIPQQQSFTPTWTASGTAPAFGNADVRCEWVREGAYIRAKYFIKFGTTTTFGTGMWKFSLPVARLVPTTTDFVGSALLKDRAGISRTLFQSSEDKLWLSDGSGNVASVTSPVTWASGDLLCIDLTYRLF